MIVPDAISRMFGNTEIEQEYNDSPEIDHPDEEENHQTSFK